MNLGKIVLLFISAWLFFGNFHFLYSQSDPLELKINSLAESLFVERLKAEGINDSCGGADPEWKPIIDRAFDKLIKSSGETPIPVCYLVVKENSFNAGALPNGKFIIHQGLLKRIDSKIGNNFFINFFKDKNKEREGYLAPIIAHELAHYYRRHIYKMLKTLSDKVANKDAIQIELDRLEISQKDELEADTTALIYLQNAGYKVDYFFEVLKILQEDHSKKQANEEKAKLPYFSTHPSPAQRIASLNLEKDLDKGIQEWYKFLFEIEIATADIELGRNLKESIKIIDSALSKYPENLYLKKAKALGLHKDWLSTVTLEEQQFRAILHLPIFREDLLSSLAKGKKGKQDTPGDLDKYYDALDYYEKNLIPFLSGDCFLSNYAVLLVFSNENKALKFANQANSQCQTTQTMNNLAIVLYFNEAREEAKKIWSSLQGYKRFDVIEKVSQDQANDWIIQMKQKQKLDPNYVDEDFTCFLNYILFLLYEKSSHDVKALAKDYLWKYDSDSEWAVYLSKITNVERPKTPPISEILVAGIKLGESTDSVTKAWKEPSRKQKIPNGGEVWVYENREARLTFFKGKLKEIRLLGPNSPKVTVSQKKLGVGVGTKKQDAEKILGNQFQQKTPLDFLYKNLGNLTLKYQSEQVGEIVLYEK